MIPNIPQAFQFYDECFFRSRLRGIPVEWSERMTSSAGLCIYRTRRNRTPKIIIRLSEPILQYRTPYDVENVLVHEMIHAYLFVLRLRDDGPHGSRWCAEARRINQATGLKITVYHQFYDEVWYLRWQQRLGQPVVLQGDGKQWVLPFPTPRNGPRESPFRSRKVSPAPSSLAPVDDDVIIISSSDPSVIVIDENSVIDITDSE
ncbi:SprT-like family protein [Giardia muris]|uniref:SprT-like family protein n=1 Tax=Giardia muris TaxID=5742 RepID=A0A4Z1SVW3_GIAMU|nr:SprT-like family protein [Giardia muris]|eukprot:TNJ29992.1 SprT-like family protein [Giardia muris]